MRIQILVPLCALLPGLLWADEPPPLTLPGLLAQVLMRSPELRARESDVRAAQELPAIARAFEDPLLMVELWQAPLDLSHVPVMFTLRQPVPWPGKLRARALALTPLKDRARAARGARARALMLEAARAYYSYWLAVRSIEVERENQKLLTTLNEVAEARYRVGKAELAEVLEAREALAALDNELLDLMERRDLAESAINTLLDLPAENPLGRPVSAPELRPTPSLAELTRAALDARPELALARASIEQAEGKLRAVRAARAPDLAVFASFMAVLRGGAGHTFTFGIESSIPSFSLARSGAMAREALAEGEARRAELAQVAAQVRGEVREALLRLETARRHIALHRDTLIPLSEQALGAARASYQSGRGDMLLLLSAARTLIRHRLEHERYLALYGERQAELSAAVGAATLEESQEVRP